MDKYTKYNATKAILGALYSGRKLSQLDCKEFMVADMRTFVSHLRKEYEATHHLRSEWILSPVRKVRLKRWWLEKKEKEESPYA